MSVVEMIDTNSDSQPEQVLKGLAALEDIFVKLTHH